MYLAYADDSRVKHNNVEWRVMATILVRATRGRCTMSAAGTRRIAAAQKARWAK